MLQFCNSYPSRTWITIEWYRPNCPDGGDWEKEGWFKLEPGECANVFDQDLDEINAYYYFYAEADDGAVWAGPFIDCVPYIAFDWCTDTCNSESRDLGYREFNIGDNDDYTITLIP